MGELRKIKGSKDEARKYITDAIPLFEECENDFLLKQAREALSALGWKYEMSEMPIWESGKFKILW